MIFQDTIRQPKVAIYIRVSTHWQVDKDSLQVQRRELIAYAQMVLGIGDYVVFEDAGYSAKNTDRPDYQAMMDRLRCGEFSVPTGEISDLAMFGQKNLVFSVGKSYYQLTPEQGSNCLKFLLYYEALKQLPAEIRR